MSDGWGKDEERMGVEQSLAGILKRSPKEKKKRGGREGEENLNEGERKEKEEEKIKQESGYSAFKMAT